MFDIYKLYVMNAIYISILLYGTVIPFNNIASDFLQSKWYPNDIETAGSVMRYII